MNLDHLHQLLETHEPWVPGASATSIMLGSLQVARFWDVADRDRVLVEHASIPDLLLLIERLTVVAEQARELVDAAFGGQSMVRALARIGRALAALDEELAA